MTKENGVKVLTDMVADFVAHIGKKLPDDVVEKLEELGSQESAALPKVLYETMTKNQGLAVELNRPSCQDTGVLQFWLKCGTNFPYINELEALLKEAVNTLTPFSLVMIYLLIIQWFRVVWLLILGYLSKAACFLLYFY